MTPAKPCRWASSATWIVCGIAVALILMGAADAVEYVLNAWRME
jgi:hypothetical protein